MNTYHALIAELQAIHRKLLQALNGSIGCDEEHQSDRLVEEIQNVWDKLQVNKTCALTPS